MHLLLGGVHQLFSLDGTIEPPLGLVLPLDDWLPASVAATLALWRTLRGRPPAEARAPTRQRRARLVLGLRALDGRDAGASYRELASGLVGPARVPDGPAWKSHDLRFRMMRLVADASALRDGGYRDLLRPNPRSLR
ncbi:DUF2285 domain-containing protein [Pararhizobium mangrovi]|uniref:DUF2285 domain-containing protein n=1 Tax=Pararhizobium mangrovi TaxID=2590452 RepID=UPI001F3BBCFD|nr:DUF2285 domain-containing protein [Pararhizobium mangrovi]